MDVASLGNRSRGDADVLTVLDHRLPLSDIPGGQLMVNDNVLRRRQRRFHALEEIRDLLPRGDWLYGHGDIILRVNDHRVH